MTHETLMDLKARRSCRAYKNEQVKDAELKQVLEAGTYAPTGMGKQSPVMVVLQDAKTIKKLSEMNRIIMGTDFDPFYGAPTVVVVLADKNAATYIEDGALVMGNLMNAAEAVGLGSCWVHRAKEEFESEEGQALLKEWGIEGDYVGIGHCILGYPKTMPNEPAPRKDDYIIYVK